MKRTLNICVLVKPIIDPVAIQWQHQHKQFAFISHRFNQADLHALQWASDYKQAYGGHLTVLVAVDSVSKCDTRQLMKWNIDECIIKKVARLDTYRNEVAYLLAAELKKRAFDVILSGSQSEDRRLGITPVTIAELLNIPVLTNVHQIEPVNQEIWQVQRKEGGSVVQTFQVRLPALIGVVSAISRKRYVPRHVAIQNEQVVSMNVSKVAINQKPKVKLLKMTEPQPNIKLFELPSSTLLAEKRLLEIMGLAQGHTVATTEKVAKEVSDRTIHYITEKLRKWLKEE